jgi:hypothetical protein
MSDRTAFNPYLYMLNENRVIWIIMGITIAQVIFVSITGWIWVHLIAVLFLAYAVMSNKGRPIRHLASPRTKPLPLEEIERRLSGITEAIIIDPALDEPEKDRTILVRLKETGAGGSISTHIIVAGGPGSSYYETEPIERMADALLLQDITDSRALREAVIEDWSMEVEHSGPLSNHARLKGMSFMSRASVAISANPQANTEVQTSPT